MRAKNSDWVIGQALASLASQDFRDYDLVVVDSGSTDRTLDLVRAYPHRLISIPPQSYYPGPVLNDAIAATSHDLVVFWNSDCVALSPHTLSRLVAAFDDVQVQAAFGRQLPRPEAHGWVRRDYAASFPATGAAPSWLPLSLVLAAMRRSIWTQRSFYRAAWGSEDVEWGHWARGAGHQVRYIADAIVMHSHNYTLRQLYGRQFIEGEADAFIHPQRRIGLLRGAVRAAAAVARDAWWCLRSGDAGGALMATPRRAVGQWAYWRGQRHGHRRRAAADGDASHGQRVVLERHESRRT